MKICTVVGARPQFIKGAVVSRAFQETGNNVVEKIIHTGQHFDQYMSDVFFCELGIPKPSYHLGIGGLSHGAMTGRMIEEIERILVGECPDWVLVYGDTNSTLAGAIAASKLHIPIAHVEAGLRSFNRAMPEEINRVLTDHAADLLFSPTNAGRDNLLAEGIPHSSIHVCGDVMYDAAIYYGGIAEAKSAVLDRLGLKSQNYILSTVHRAENTDELDKLAVIVEGLKELSMSIPIVFPIHPRTRKVLQSAGMAHLLNGLIVIDPVGYLDMVALERNSSLIMTDSGGVQKEAFFFGVPCLTLRTETEWIELVQLGVNRLVAPVSKLDVVREAMQLLSIRGQMDFSNRPYGDGKAGQKIVTALTKG